jgi:hypothetical protein
VIAAAFQDCQGGALTTAELRSNLLLSQSWQSQQQHQEQQQQQDSYSAASGLPMLSGQMVAAIVDALWEQLPDVVGDVAQVGRTPLGPGWHL